MCTKANQTNQPLSQAEKLSINAAADVLCVGRDPLLIEFLSELASKDRLPGKMNSELFVKYNVCTYINHWSFVYYTYNSIHAFIHTYIYISECMYVLYMYIYIPMHAYIGLQPDVRGNMHHTEQPAAYTEYNHFSRMISILDIVFKFAVICVCVFVRARACV